MANPTIKAQGKKGWVTMKKSVATKVRIENRREAKKIFNLSTRRGKEAYREFLRGIILSKPYYDLCKREALGDYSTGAET